MVPVSLLGRRVALGKIERTRGRKGKKGFLFFIYLFIYYDDVLFWGFLYIFFIIIWTF